MTGTDAQKCWECDEKVSEAGYTVRCVDCRQSVDHHQAHIVKTNHGSGRGWRCNRCGLVADEFIRAVNARIDARLQDAADPRSEYSFHTVTPHVYTPGDRIPILQDDRRINTAVVQDDGTLLLTGDLS